MLTSNVCVESNARNKKNNSVPHRAVRNGEAAKFDSTFSFLPHLPDATQ